MFDGSDDRRKEASKLWLEKIMVRIPGGQTIRK